MKLSDRELHRVTLRAGSHFLHHRIRVSIRVVHTGLDRDFVRGVEISRRYDGGTVATPLTRAVTRDIVRRQDHRQVIEHARISVKPQSHLAWRVVVEIDQLEVIASNLEWSVGFT